MQWLKALWNAPGPTTNYLASLSPHIPFYRYVGWEQQDAPHGSGSDFEEVENV